MLLCTLPIETFLVDNIQRERLDLSGYNLHKGGQLSMMVYISLKEPYLFQHPSLTRKISISMFKAITQHVNNGELR